MHVGALKTIAEDLFYSPCSNGMVGTSEAPKQEVYKQEASKKEASKKEASKKEAPKKEVIRKAQATGGVQIMMEVKKSSSSPPPDKVPLSQQYYNIMLHAPHLL